MGVKGLTQLNLSNIYVLIIQKIKTRQKFYFKDSKQHFTYRRKERKIFSVRIIREIKKM